MHLEQCSEGTTVDSADILDTRDMLGTTSRDRRCIKSVNKRIEATFEYLGYLLL